MVQAFAHVPDTPYIGLDENAAPWSVASKMSEVPYIMAPAEATVLSPITAGNFANSTPVNVLCSQPSNVSDRATAVASAAATLASNWFDLRATAALCPSPAEAPLAPQAAVVRSGDYSANNVAAIAAKYAGDGENPCAASSTATADGSRVRRRSVRRSGVYFTGAADESNDMDAISPDTILPMAPVTAEPLKVHSASHH